MKSLICITVVVVLLCAGAICQSNASSSANPTDSKQERSEAGKKKKKKSKSTDCAKARRTPYYTLYLRAPGAKRRVNFYDADHPEQGDHPAICLSKGQGDTMLWLSGDANPFTVTITPQKASEEKGNCGKHPFVKDPPPGQADGYFSGAIRRDTPEGCKYDVEFNFRNGQKADPHIEILR